MLLTIALRNALRNGRRSLATVAAITVGLAAVNLFGGYIADVYASLQYQAVVGERLGHLTVFKKGMLTQGKLKPQKYMFTASESANAATLLKATPGVKLVSPRMSVSGIASNGRASTIFIGEGVVAEHADVLRGDGVEGGAKLDPGKQNGIAVSSELAQLLGYVKGDTITLLTATLDGQANAMDATIVDVFNTGNINTNDKFVLTPVRFASKLLDTESTERFVVLLDDVALTDSKRDEIVTRLKTGGFDVEVKTWRELSSFYTQVRGLFTMIFSFIASIVFVVATMSIANAMGMTVLERTREVGSLQAMGMQRGTVVRMFALEAVWLAAIGVVSGLALTMLLAFGVNAMGISYVPPNSSYAVPLRVALDGTGMAVVSMVVVMLALFAALLPAWRAARRNIVDALAFN